MRYLVGIDDTDTLDSPGTNQLARHLARRVRTRFELRGIVRHQLLADPRVPFTSKNGSASMVLVPISSDAHQAWLVETLRDEMRRHFVVGSDPGLCVAETVSHEVREFGRRCQREIVCQQDARDLAARTGLHLEGLGGTEGGVIGALAAVGLAAGGNDGRIVMWREWPDDMHGAQPVARLFEREIVIRRDDDDATVDAGVVDVGKKLRPNLRQHQAVLYVRPNTEGDLASVQWVALKKL